MTFEDLGLSPSTLKGVTDAGYTTPTPIQEQAIPLILMGRDVLGIAQTGTGKTAGFTLPMIDILAEGRAKARMPRSVIIAPTRELAAQVSDNFVKYGKYQNLCMALLIGGESMAEQERVLDRGVDVLIATPGRLLDLFERGRIILNDVRILVIDEADRMLDMGFIPDVERIVSLIPTTAYFVAAYGAAPGKGLSPAIDAVLTTWPPSGFPSSIGKNDCRPWTTPQRLTLITHFQSRSESSCSMPPPPTPALLHRRWHVPKRERTSSASAATCSSLVTST